jgi:hypothetical protein
VHIPDVSNLAYNMKRMVIDPDVHNKELLLLDCQDQNRNVLMAWNLVAFHSMFCTCEGITIPDIFTSLTEHEYISKPDFLLLALTNRDVDTGTSKAARELFTTRLSEILALRLHKTTVVFCDKAALLNINTFNDIQKITYSSIWR